MTDHDTYPCPWCETDRPRTTDPCPECGHIDRASIVPGHVHGLPGGDAVVGVPMALKVLIGLLVFWLLMTLAFIVKYG